MENNTAATPALKTCPCCAGPAAFGLVRYDATTVRANGWDRDTFHTVACMVCGLEASGVVGFKTQDEAAEAWNCRQEAGSVKQPVMGLRRAALAALRSLWKGVVWLVVVAAGIVVVEAWRGLPVGQQIGLAIIAGASLVAFAIAETMTGVTVRIPPSDRDRPGRSKGEGRP